MFREFKIRRTLRKLAKQRVVMFLEPGHVPLLDHGIENNENNLQNLMTCDFRGWVELYNYSNVMEIEHSHDIENGDFQQVPLYRITSEGWRIIDQSRHLQLFTFWTTVISLALLLYKFFS